ncbi:MAG: NfeD family protein [Oscillospiraceae bacterium]|jgi:membrane protein implicated in regulation of membrane protease activity|nr:NfeD family protein [Oscillospiraceae bacterium]
MNPILIFWFVLIVAFTAIEAATMNVTSIWFVIGSLAGLLCALFGGSVPLQILLFVLASGVSLALGRPFMKKYLDVAKTPTNADRVLGMVGTVTEEINNTLSTGAVTVGGRVWTARSLTGEVLKVGAYVRPQAIDGVKLIVKPVEYDRGE